jgi:hypothetical protein
MVLGPTTAAARMSPVGSGRARGFAARVARTHGAGPATAPREAARGSAVLAPQALGEGQLVGHPHRLHGLQGRKLTALLLAQGAGEFLEHAGLGGLRFKGAGAPARAPLLQQTLRKGHRGALEVRLDTLIDESQRRPPPPLLPAAITARSAPSPGGAAAPPKAPSQLWRPRGSARRCGSDRRAPPGHRPGRCRAAPGHRLASPSGRDPPSGRSQVELGTSAPAQNKPPGR